MISVSPLRIFLILIFFSASVFAQNSLIDKRYFYIVKEQDTASEILYRASIKPLYLENGQGTVNELKKDNSNNLEKIYPGQKIYFSQKTLEKGLKNGLVKISEKNEVIFISAPESSMINAPAATLPETNSTAVPETKPVAAQASENLSQPSYLMLSFGTGYSRIDSTYSANHSNASLLSDRALLLSASLLQTWTPEWATYLKLFTTKTTYRNPQQGRIEGNRKFLTEINFGVKTRLDQSNHINYGLGVKEVVFVPSYVSNMATLDNKPLVFLELGYSHEFVKKGVLTLGGAAGFKYYLPDSGQVYSVDHGQDYSIAGFVMQDKTTYDLVAELQYIQRNFKTSLTSQKESFVAASLSVVIPYEDFL